MSESMKTGREQSHVRSGAACGVSSEETAPMRPCVVSSVDRDTFERHSDEPSDSSLLAHTQGVNELLGEDLGPMEFIVEPFFPTAGSGLLYGPAGHAKTWIAQRLAVAVSSGQPFLGFPVPRARRVLLIDGVYVV